jgi:hypothetical protein
LEAWRLEEWLRSYKEWVNDDRTHACSLSHWPTYDLPPSWYLLAGNGPSKILCKVNHPNPSNEEIPGWAKQRINDYGMELDWVLSTYNVIDGTSIVQLRGWWISLEAEETGCARRYVADPFLVDEKGVAHVKVGQHDYDDDLF